jgi:hypothetical protein
MEMGMRRVGDLERSRKFTRVLERNDTILRKGEGRWES